MKNNLNLLHHIRRTAARFCLWLIDLPYKAIALKVARKIGTFLHFLLFDFLLPRRWRRLSKEQIYRIIFRSDTPTGRKFDVWLLVLIALNILLLMVESFPSVQKITWLNLTLRLLEWGFTLLFTFEYYLRIYSSDRPRDYVLSFWGVIDFLSIFPSYLSLLLPGAQTFTVFRLLRMLRVFRIFNMRGFMKEGYALIRALRRSAMKVLIFMLFVYIMAVILGSIMYAVECEKNPEVFSSIPNGIYWAVVTLTTVGYGDMTPITPAGRFISIVVMILGYSIIAVPTGIVAGETIVEHRREDNETKRARNRHRKSRTHADTAARETSAQQPHNDEEDSYDPHHPTGIPPLPDMEEMENMFRD